MYSENELRRTVVIRFAAIASGLQTASDATRAAALNDAIRYSVTNTESIREGLLLRLLGLQVAASANGDRFTARDATATQEIAA